MFTKPVSPPTCGLEEFWFGVVALWSVYSYVHLSVYVFTQYLQIGFYLFNTTAANQFTFILYMVKIKKTQHD